MHTSWDSEQLIGNVHSRFDRLQECDISGHIFDWRSFYKGWIEGRLFMLGKLTEKSEFDPPV
jgi:hypothetical protein